MALRRLELQACASQETGQRGVLTSTGPGARHSALEFAIGFSIFAIVIGAASTIAASLKLMSRGASDSAAAHRKCGVPPLRAH